HDWPANGPPRVWERKVGSGLAGVAVAGGKAILFHREGDREVVEALDATTGRALWKADFPTSYRASFVDDDGPRCVPVIHEGSVYVFGAQGGLRALELNTGETRWGRETHKEFGAQEGYFGAGSTPIVVAGRLIVNVGGARTGAGMVAFDLKDGQTLWQAVDDQASYSSPVAYVPNGIVHLICITRLNVVSLDPFTGKVRFQFPFGQRGPTVNGANPVVVGGRLFLTASYGVGAVFAQFGSDSAKTLWTSDDILSSQYTTPIALDGMLYGIDGRQDLGVAELRCIDPAKREVKWSRPEFGYATLILADGKLLAMKSDGELVVVRPDPEKYVELARAQLVPGTARALPALAEGLFYVRDEKVLRCLDLRARE
ncbi:MAG: PQQ-binding-like beta-propeller repeat protein, partial [Planctomycetales bacterium]